MIITCEKCSTQFVLDDTLIKPEGSKVRCSECRHIFTAFPPDHPEIELSERPKPEEQDIPFDESEIQNQLDFNASQDDDFDRDSDSHSQDADLEDMDIDFSEIEFDEQEFEQNPPERQAGEESPDSQNQDIEIEDPSQDFDEDGLDFETVDFEINEPELDFQDDGLKLDTQEFEFEFEEIKNETSSEPASIPTDSDTADIEISFDQDDDAGAELELELEELSFDMDDSAVEASSIDDLELDTKQDDAPELEFEDDFQADLLMEDDDDRNLSPDPGDALIDTHAQEQEEIIEGQPDIKNDSFPANDVTLEFDDRDEEPDDQDADEKIEQTASEQDKFAEYDKVLEQETEPEDTGITIPAPELEDNTASAAPTLTPTNGEIETSTEALIEQEPLITPPSAQSVRQKRSTKKKKGVSLAVTVLILLVLLILAAYVAIIRFGVTIPVVSDIQIPFITQWFEPKQTPQPPLKPILDEPSINGRFVSNKSAGDLFIVTGRIKNASNTAVSYIQVKGTLMKKDNAKAGTLIAYCGNIIPEETLKSGNISDITKQMGVKQGNQNTNVNIKPGASVMFMLIFSNLPEDLSNFTVALEGFEAAQE